MKATTETYQGVEVHLRGREAPYRRHARRKQHVRDAGGTVLREQLGTIGPDERKHGALNVHPQAGAGRRGHGPVCGHLCHECLEELHDVGGRHLCGALNQGAAHAQD